MSAVTVGLLRSVFTVSRLIQALHYINIKIFTRRILNIRMLILIMKSFAFIYLNLLKNKKKIKRQINWYFHAIVWLFANCLWHKLFDSAVTRKDKKIFQCI